MSLRSALNGIKPVTKVVKRDVCPRNSSVLEILNLLNVMTQALQNLNTSFSRLMPDAK